jgi:hypothetical protein
VARAARQALIGARLLEFLGVLHSCVC